MSSYIGINEKAADLEALQLISRKSSLSIENIDKITDASWIKQSFLILSGAVSDEEKINRTFNSAVFKFQDSSIGGNYVINPRAQYTRYADIPVRSKMWQNKELSVGSSDIKIGMGHYYSEAIDDTGQTIHLRFGVPQFNSMTTFFTGFFDTRAATAARTGRLDRGFFEGLGEILGFTTYLLTWPLVIASILGNGLRFAMNKPSSSFYYFKPTMPTYWLAVNNMVNQIGINKGLFPDELEANAAQVSGTTYRIDAEAMRNISEMMPDVFSETGGIDVFSISSRGQRIKNQLDNYLFRTLNSSNGSDDQSLMEGFVNKYTTGLNVEPALRPGNRGTISNLINAWLSTETGTATEPDKATDFERSFKVNADGTPAPYPNSFGDYLAAEYDDGGAFVSLRVNSTGPVSESFSNTVVESDLGNKFNSTAAANKAAYFSFAGGNLVGGAIGSVVGGVAGAVKDFASGVLNSLQIGGLFALGGAAFVNIPKHWENSSASLPKANYSINLVSPYNNPISQLTNIYIPLCIILAGALPLATGRQSYTSPFLVQLYDRGRQQTRLGMIDSVTVTRGVTNLGFNKEGQALGVEISFSVVDLSSVIAMPIASKSFLQRLLNPLDGVLDDDNIYTDYLNVLSSLSLYDQIYTSSRLKLNLARRRRTYEQLFSKAKTAMFIRDNVGVLDILFKGAQRDTGGSQRSGLFTPNSVQ
jgi:hypothetical protein